MKKYLILILISILAFSCKSIPKLTEDEETDFAKTGFINEHYYQIIIKSMPDSGLKSLLEQRENASVKNANKLNSEIENSIKTEIKNSYSDRLTDIEIEQNFESENFKAKLLTILNYGNIVYNFYDDRNNNIIVYRIKRKNIRSVFNTFLDDTEE